MTMKPNIATLALLAAFASSAAAAPPGSGTTGQWTVADAIAWRDPSGTHIVFSDKAFDRVAIAGDRRLDSSDITSHQMSPLNGQTYEIRLDPDGSLGGLGISSPGGTSSRYSSSMAEGLKVDRNEESHIAGSFIYEGASLHFDLPVHSGELSRPGTALPADGGEPGKVLLAQIKAVEKGDYDTLVELSPPEYRESMLKQKGTPDAAMEMTAAKAFTPSIVRISGGSIDGDRAWLDFTGRQGDEAIKGIAILQRSDGRWYVRNLETRQAD